MENDIVEVRAGIARMILEILNSENIIIQKKGNAFELRMRPFLDRYSGENLKDPAVNRLFTLADDLFDGMNHGALFVEGYSFASLESELRTWIAIALEEEERAR